MYQIIGLVGFKGSGKDTVANKLREFKPYSSVAFADSLKDCVSSIFGWDRSQLIGDTRESRAWRETIDPWWADRLGIPEFTPRWAMTNFGTDLMRRHFDERIWLLNTERRMNQISGNIIVSDCRFPNEIALVKSLGGTVGWVRRGPNPPWYSLALMANMGCSISRQAMSRLDVHESEWAWIGTVFDFNIDNNGSIDDLTGPVKEIAFG